MERKKQLVMVQADPGKVWFCGEKTIFKWSLLLHGCFILMYQLHISNYILCSLVPVGFGQLLPQKPTPNIPVTKQHNTTQQAHSFFFSYSVQKRGKHTVCRASSLTSCCPSLRRVSVPLVPARHTPLLYPVGCAASQARSSRDRDGGDFLSF